MRADEVTLDDPRQARINQRLELIGPGPAAFFRDACRVMSDPSALESSSHLVGHLLREIESAIRDVLLEPERGGHASKGKERHRSEVLRVLSALEISDSSELGLHWLRFASGEEGLARHAHRDALSPPRSAGGAISETWQKMQAILDGVLAAFEERYERFHCECDALLEITEPTTSDVDRLLGSMPHGPVARSDFYGRLAHPGWIPALRKRGVFLSPPPAILGERDGSVQFPPWPELSYLIRMASLSPELVAEIAAEVPDTDNALVHSDLARLAYELPPEHGAPLVSYAEGWLDTGRGLSGLTTTSHWLTELTVKLAEGGEGAAATDLLVALLTLHRTEPNGRSSLFSLTPRTEAWQYNEVRRKCVSSVVNAGGLPAFARLVGVLADALADLDGECGPSDTRSWRPIIAECQQNFDSPLSGLVSVVRRAALQLVREGAAGGTAVLAELDAREGAIFRRLSLHVAQHSLASEEAHAARYLEDRGLFDDDDVSNEYWSLAESALPRFPVLRGRILAWVQERAVDNSERWLLRRLAAFGSSLPPALAERRLELEARFGPLAFPYFAVTVMPGRSELDDSIPSLEGKTLSEVLSTLSAWRPPQSAFRTPRRELAQALAGRVSGEAGAYSAAAAEFRSLHSRYVCAVLGGLKDAVAAGADIAWPPVIALCQWAVAQPRTSPTDDGVDGVDSDDWGWARRQVQELFTAAMRAESPRLPPEQREQVWSVIEQMIDDPDPREVPDHRKAWDPMMQLANTVRGGAMETALQFANWVANGSAPRLPSEVRAVLDARLDPAKEPSVAVRAFYGRYFPNLVALDPEWAGSAVRLAFASGGSVLEAAAWETYLLTNVIYSNVWPVLESYYESAVDRVEEEPVFSWREDPRATLGFHLAVLAWRGALGTQEGMLPAYFGRAPLACRSQVLEWIGRGLREQQTITAVERDRLEKLWELARHHPDDSLSAFGWWFGASCLDEQWRLAQLGAVLEQATEADAGHVVVETLAELAVRHPGPVVRCLRQMVEADEDGWHVFSWRDDAKRLLEQVTGCADPAAVAAARALANLLVARGRMEFRPLATRTD